MQCSLHRTSARAEQYDACRQTSSRGSVGAKAGHGRAIFITGPETRRSVRVLRPSCANMFPVIVHIVSRPCKCEYNTVGHVTIVAVGIMRSEMSAYMSLVPSYGSTAPAREPLPVVSTT